MEDIFIILILFTGVFSWSIGVGPGRQGRRMLLGPGILIIHGALGYSNMNISISIFNLQF